MSSWYKRFWATYRPAVMGVFLGYKKQTCLYCILKVMSSSEICCHIIRHKNTYAKEFQKKTVNTARSTELRADLWSIVLNLMHKWHVNGRQYTPDLQTATTDIWESVPLWHQRLCQSVKKLESSFCCQAETACFTPASTYQPGVSYRILRVGNHWARYGDPREGGPSTPYRNTVNN